MRLPPVLDGAVAVALLPQVGAQLEVGLAFGHAVVAGPGPLDDFVGRQREPAPGALVDPVPQHADVVSGDLDLGRLGQDLVHAVGHAVDRLIAAGGPVGSGVGRFGRPHDHAVLVDPDAVRDVVDAELLGHLVVGVDQRWVGRVGVLDVLAARFGAGRVHPDGHELDALGMQLFPERLPHGQVVGAASVGSPGDDEDLLVAQTAEAELVPVEVGQDELGRDRGAQGVAGQCLGPDGIDVAGLVVDDGHAEPAGHGRDGDGSTAVVVGRAGREGHAHLALAGAFGFQLPTGRRLELLGRHAQLRGDHRV